MFIFNDPNSKYFITFIIYDRCVHDRNVYFMFLSLNDLDENIKDLFVHVNVDMSLLICVR